MVPSPSLRSGQANRALFSMVVKFITQGTRAPLFRKPLQNFFAHRLLEGFSKPPTGSLFVRGNRITQFRAAHSTSNGHEHNPIKKPNPKMEDLTALVSQGIIFSKLFFGVLAAVTATITTFFSADLIFAYGSYYWNENSLYSTIEKGVCEELSVDEDQLISRKDLLDNLETIFRPLPDSYFYYIILGEHGTGKTTSVIQAVRKVGNGVVYFSAPNEAKTFADDLAETLNWSFMEHITVTAAMRRKILGIPIDSSSQEDKLSRVLKAFLRGAKKYKIKNGGKPPVLIFDNINKLVKNPELFHLLQDEAKSQADKKQYIMVFVSSEGNVPMEMMKRSAFSRAMTPLVIGDISSNDALTYLKKNFKIEGEKAKQLYDLVGGRFLDLKMYGKSMSEGRKFEDLQAEAFSKIKKIFVDNKMAPKDDNYNVGKRIFSKLLKEKEISFDDYRALVGDLRLADKILQANILSHDPVTDNVTFQSRLTEMYVKMKYFKT